MIVTPISSDQDDNAKKCGSIPAGEAKYNAASKVENGHTSAPKTLENQIKVLVHVGLSCFGEDCVHKWTQPIIGERYECLTCKNLMRKHNFCASCYQAYTFKSKTLAESLETNITPEKKATAVETKNIFISARIHSKCLRNDIVEHVFRCVSKPGTNEPQELCDQQTINKRFKPKAIEDVLKKATEFSEMDFVVFGMVLYPLGLLNLMLNRLFTKPLRIGDKDQCNQNAGTNITVVWRPLRWYLRRTQHWSQYFGNLPWISVGICLILNAAAIVGIEVYQSKNGYAATLYWRFVYETFFVQSLTVQVQLFMVETNKRNVALFVLGAVTGFSFMEQCLEFSLDSSNIHRFISYMRAHTESGEAIVDSHQFVFPAPAGINVSDDEDVKNQPNEKSLGVLDPVKASFVDPTDSNATATLLTIVVMVAFAILIATVSIFAIDTSLMIKVFGDQIRLPEMVTYNISHSTSIVSGCNDGDQTIARIILGLHLTPVPTSARGLPQLSLQFLYRNYTKLNVSMEMFWYADFVTSSSNKIQLQVLENHDFIPMIVSFPNTSCSSTSTISFYPKQAYPALQGLETIRDRRVSSWRIAFYILIACPSIIVSSCFRALFVCLIIASTWGLWDVFNSFTDLGVNGGVWSTDHLARLQINFSDIRNVLAWYNLRNRLCEITFINLRTAIPMFRFAVVQFVIALATVCWYAVSGNAPIPGFAYLVFLCVNPLMVLMFIFPLNLIWRIQYSHIALLAQKIRHVESLSATLEPGRAEERRNASHVLSAIKAELETSDKRVAVLGFELSPGFLKTLATFAATGVSFLFGSKIQYHVTDG